MLFAPQKGDGPLKNKKCWPFALLAALLLLVGEAALILPGFLAAGRTAPAVTFAGDDNTTRMPAAALAAGRYLVTVSYAAVGQGAELLQTEGTSEEIWQPLALPQSSSGVAAAWLNLPQGGHLGLAAAPGEPAGEDGQTPATVALRAVTIDAAPALRQAAANRLALAAFADLLLLGLLLLWYGRKKLSPRSLLILAVLLGTAALASGPVLGGGLWHGSDLGYHLRRIENIAAALSAGQFPVRIQPDWVNGYGYAVGVFYGDAFLYLPALLRLAGFSVTQCYIGYLEGVNLATAGLAYLAFRGMAGARGPALVGAVHYTLAPYRLFNLYDRAALGEYTALAFLPVVAWGFWRIYAPHAGAAGKKVLPGWLLLALGMTGVLFSHLLSLEMTALLLILFALVLAPKTFSPRVLRPLCGAVAAFLALGAGFLVPFFDFYLTGKFEINSPGGTEPIRVNGAQLPQLFGFAGEGGGYGELRSLTPGWALWLGALLFAVLLCLRLALTHGKWAALPGAPRALGLGGLLAGLFACFAATRLFPWDALYALGGAGAALTGSLQFPWRFLGPASLLLSLAAVAGLCLLRPGVPRLAVGASLCLLCAAGAVRQAQAYQAQAAPINYVYGTEEPNWQLSCEHYLPTENGEVDFYDLPVSPQWSDGVTIHKYDKTGTAVTVACENTAAAQGSIRLTLLYYKGYAARDAATGGALPVVCGQNNCAALLLPPGYSGTAEIFYRAPWYWHLGEGLSLAAALALAGWLALRKPSRK